MKLHYNFILINILPPLDLNQKMGFISKKYEKNAESKQKWSQI